MKFDKRDTIGLRYLKVSEVFAATNLEDLLYSDPEVLLQMYRF